MSYNLTKTSLQSLRTHLMSSYIKAYEDEEKKLTAECNFKPDLNLTKSFNQQNFHSPSRSTYIEVED